MCVANIGNLRPAEHKLTLEEQKKGAAASIKARRERKKFKDDLLIALDAIKNGKTVQEIGIAAIIDKFMDGDIQAFNTIRDTIGEKPTDKIEADVGATVIRVDVEDE